MAAGPILHPENNKSDRQDIRYVIERRRYRSTDENTIRNSRRVSPKKTDRNLSLRTCPQYKSKNSLFEKTSPILFVVLIPWVFLITLCAFARKNAPVREGLSPLVEAGDFR